MSYTGTILPDMDLFVPTFGTDEGRSLRPNRQGLRRGENLAPLLNFPYASPAVTITDAHIDQRYWKAGWLDVVFDAKSSQGTSRSRVYQADVRYYDFHLSKHYRTKDNRRPRMIKQITLRLRMPVTPPSPVFPSFTQVAKNSEYGYIDPATGKEVKGKLTEGFVDLPVGGFADDLVALSPLRVGANGEVGFPLPPWSNGPLPIGTAWTGRYVRVPDKGEMEEMRVFMGCAGKTPYKLNLTRGKMKRLAYMAYLEAKDFAVAGTIDQAKQMPYQLPLSIQGVNANWASAV